MTDKCADIGSDDLPCQAEARFRILPAAGEQHGDILVCALHVGLHLNDNARGHLVVPCTEAA